MEKNINSKRSTVQIPPGTDIHDFLFVKNGHKAAKWKVLNELVTTRQRSRQEYVYNRFKEFLNEANELYPHNDVSTKLDMLWPLIAKRILKIPTHDGNEAVLSESFYQEIKKL